MNTCIRNATIALVLLGSQNPAQAQSVPLAPGDHLLQLGVGLGGPWSIRFDETSSSPLVQFTYEHALAEVLGTGLVGIGASVGYKGLRKESSLGRDSYCHYDERYTVVPVGLRIVTHYGFGLARLDTCGGAGAGINLVKRTIVEQAPGAHLFTSDEHVKSHFAYSLLVGARYAIGKRFGPWTELACGNAWWNFGASLTL